MKLNELELDEYGQWRGEGLLYHSVLSKAWMPVLFLDAGSFGKQIMLTVWSEEFRCEVEIKVSRAFENEMEFCYERSTS